MTLSASVTFDFKTFTNTLYVSICNSFGIGKKECTAIPFLIIGARLPQMFIMIMRGLREIMSI